MWTKTALACRVVKIADLRYELKPERIAQAPASPRDSARLFVAGAAAGGASHRRIRDLPDLLEPGTLVVVNDTRVRKARLRGVKRGSGGAVELLLVRPIEQRSGGGRWECMGRASKPLRVGAVVDFEGIEATVLERRGKIVIADLITKDGGNLEVAIEVAGEVPLPPYITRAARVEDAENYQTMFARELGASAAPTASLHFTPALVEALRATNVQFAATTLHVGLGTFESPTVADLDDHPMHAEPYVMPRETVEAIAVARARGSKVLAIGTTVVRALESAADPERPGHVLEGRGDTRLLIQPGYEFRVVDRMLTNFHLPESTLLALVGAFVGLEPMWRIYGEALGAEYRFFSYGDAMLLERKGS